MQAQTTGTFVQIGGLQINTLTATTTYANQTLELPDAPGRGVRRQGPSRPRARARCDRLGRSSIPTTRRCICRRWRCARRASSGRPRPAATPTIKYGNEPDPGEGPAPGQRRSVARRRRARSRSATIREIGGVTVHAKNVDIAQLEKLTLQNRGFTGRLNADAKISGNAKAPDVTGHVDVDERRLPAVQVSVADRRWHATPTTAIGVDARLVQTPGVELTAKGTRAAERAARRVRRCRRARRAGARRGASTCTIQSTRMDLGIVQGFTTPADQRDRHGAGRRHRHRIRRAIRTSTATSTSRTAPSRVPQAGVTFTGMTTRIELQQDRIRVPRFQILDQHGKPLTIQGDLAVHERRPARSTSRSTPTTSS